MEKYPFQLRELSKEDGGGYMITFPDLPGCMSDGDTPEEAIRNGDNAVTKWMAARKKWGKEIPVPTPPIAHVDFSGKFIQRVPKSVHAQLVKRADKEGISMNQLVTSFIVSGLKSSGWSFDPSLKILHGTSETWSDEDIIQKLVAQSQESILEVMLEICEADFKDEQARNIVFHSGAVEHPQVKFLRTMLRSYKTITKHEQEGKPLSP